eukprot:tig00020510_g9943.t1
MLVLSSSSRSDKTPAGNHRMSLKRQLENGAASDHRCDEAQPSELAEKDASATDEPDAKRPRPRTASSSSAADPSAHPAAPGAEPGEDAGEGATLLGRLPSELIARILKLRDAAAARLVCRLWREAIEQVSWSTVSVKARHPETLHSLAAQVATDDHDGQRSDRRWIRVAPGATLCMSLGREEGPEGDGCFRAAVALVETCAAASGPGGLGQVVVFGTGVERTSAPLSPLGDMLGAVVPRGSAVCPALRALVLFDFDFLVNERFLTGLDLRPSVFPNLKTLVAQSAGRADEAAVDALARGAPGLKTLHISLTGPGALAGLAGFTSLEDLSVRCKDPDLSRDADVDAAPLLEALASGPAARSLKKLDLSRAGLSRAAMRALPRLAALKQLDGKFNLAPDVGREELAALGACPALRSLGPLALDGRGDGELLLAARLGGLAAAATQSPSLALDLRVALPAPPPALALASLARAARGRLSLALEFDLAPGRPAEVAAVLAAAPPRRLHLEARVDEAALGGGWLDGLAAFAGCSAGELKARLNLHYRVRDREDAAKAAAARALGVPPECIEVDTFFSL